MPSLVRRCALPLSVAIVAGVLATLPAVAAPSWVPAVEVQNDGVNFPGDPVVAVDADGGATMVWLSESPLGDLTVQASTHPVGGSWSAPQDLSGPSAVQGELDLAVDAAGDAVVAWTEGVTPDRVVRVRTRVAGGAWAPAATLPYPADSADPTVAIDDAGNAVALWSGDVGGSSAILGATASLGGTWSRFPDALSDPDTNAEDPDVVVLPDGRATAVWTHFDQVALNNVIETAARASAVATFGTATSISDSAAKSARPVVALNAAGAATAAWEQWAPDADHVAVHAATRTAGEWSDPVMLSSAPNPIDDQDEKGDVRVVLDATGSSTVAWRRSFRVVDTDPRTRSVESTFTAAGTWTLPAVLLGAASDRSGLGLTLDGAGTVTAAWPSEGPIGRVSVTRREVGGAWTGAIGIESGAGRTSGVAAAASPAGDVVVGYGFAPSASASGILHARAFDVDGPLVRSLSVPASGTAGQPVSYAVAAADAWSPIASTGWSFGDGTSASGASVTHTFGAAGTYSVSATVTDSNGNARTRTGTTVIAAAPVVVTPLATPKPALTGVKLTQKTIHVVASDEKPRATRLKLTLNTAATVIVRLKRTQKVDGKVVKAKVATSLKAGKGAIRLTSKVGSKKLPPGTYKVVVVAKNVVGTSAAKTLELKIKK